MEEDIKILEELVQNIKRVNERTLDCEIKQWCKEKQAIENLIKGYRELEEKNKYWNDRIEYAKKETKGLKMYEMGMAWEDMKEENEELRKNYINPSKARISYYDTKKGTEVVIEGFIPKSKVKELHKEYYEKAFAEPYDCTTADYKHSQAMGGWRALNKLLMEDK